MNNEEFDEIKAYIEQEQKAGHYVKVYCIGDNADQPAWEIAPNEIVKFNGSTIEFYNKICNQSSMVICRNIASLWSQSYSTLDMKKNE